MHTIQTQQELRAVRNLPFCYLCGEPLAADDDTDLDHVPPECIFDKCDRDPPLKLRVHKRCNGEQSQDDELIGQIVAVIHGKHPGAAIDKRDMTVYKTDQFATPMCGLRGTSVEWIIWRWLRGFHAALYGERLPPDARPAIHTPFWRGTLEGNDLHVRGPHSIEPLYVEIVKKNRLLGRLDRIVTCTGKCVYECVWTRADQGGWLCIFGLRLYEWERLGDHNLPQRGCMGCYSAPRGLPLDASTATELEFPMHIKVPLDPFGG